MAKVYSIGSRAQPNLSQIKTDDNYRNLIQDFEFDEASLRLRKTKDNKYIVATGIMSLLSNYPRYIQTST
jgi:hypothetical protein